MKVRVMTFNIRGFYNRDGANAWPAREALNIATIRRCLPDIIGLQEANGRNIAVYHRELPDYHYIAWPPYNNAAPHQFPAIFWRPERLRPRQCETFWLSETPDIYSGSWDTDCIRSAAWVRFAVGGTEAQLVHLNTHLDHISEQARLQGARLIIERVRQSQAGGAAAIITGDFNASPQSATHDLFSAAGYVDAHAACSDGEEVQAYTYHGFQGESFRGSEAPPRRIDWILLRDGSSMRITPIMCEIVRDAAPPVYPSDHYPVIADIEVA